METQPTLDSKPGVAQPTPGEWSLNEDFQIVTNHMESDALLAQVLSLSDFPCWDGDEEEEATIQAEYKANGYRMAASKNMYAALKRFLKDEGTDEDLGVPYCNCFGEGPRCLYCEARAALAKAEGQVQP